MASSAHGSEQAYPNELGAIRRAINPFADVDFAGPTTVAVEIRCDDWHQSLFLYEVRPEAWSPDLQSSSR